MLKPVASTLPEWKTTKLSYLSYDATKGQLPRLDSVDYFDAVIVTGSGCSAFESRPWISKLQSFITGLYKDKPRIRLFGSCFGHQIICHALFGVRIPSEIVALALTFSSNEHQQASEEEDFPHGGRLSPPNPNPVVSRNPKGWEIRVHAINLSAKFMVRFGAVSSNPVAPSQMRLRLIHRDHVNPNSVPDDFVKVGGSELSEIQGVYKRGRVLTLQGHPEFDDEVILDSGKPILGDRVADKIRTGQDDSQYAARAILEFLREEVVEERVGEGRAADGVTGGGVNEEVTDTGVEGAVTEVDVVTRLIPLFEKLTVCERALVLRSG
ncbi:hypothetical protein V492_01111 [Pseudogymnoascus sp. VKM F-4246]|nr:hypothetical protein V492_01111 [Pseudogymnoascus sp. VKM F-4246]